MKIFVVYCRKCQAFRYDLVVAAKNLKEAEEKIGDKAKAHDLTHSDQAWWDMDIVPFIPSREPKRKK